MRKVLILTLVSAAAILIAAGNASAGGDGHVRGARAGSGPLTTSAGNSSGPVVRDHRNGSSQGGSQTGGRGNATVRDHRRGSSQTSGWGDGAKVRDHRKPVLDFHFKGPF